MQIQHIDTTPVVKTGAIESAAKRTTAKLTLVSDGRQIQLTGGRIPSNRDEAVRAAMLRTG